MINMNKPPMDKEQIWENFIRGMAVLVVFYLLFLSVKYLTDGFGIVDPEHRWMGLGLGISGVVLQLIFNRGANSPTLFLIGLASYIYGFIMTWRGLNAVDINKWITYPLAFVIEVGPESIFLWALNPSSGKPFDFVSALVSGITRYMSGSKRGRTDTPKQYRSTPYPGTNPMSNGQRTDGRAGVRTDIGGASGEGVDARVRSFALRYAGQNGGQLPSARTVAQEIRGVAKTKANQLLNQIAKDTGLRR